MPHVHIFTLYQCKSQSLPVLVSKKIISDEQSEFSLDRFFSDFWCSFIAIHKKKKVSRCFLSFKKKKNQKDTCEFIFISHDEEPAEQGENRTSLKWSTSNGVREPS
jgi:hypothetical protein